MTQVRALEARLRAWRGFRDVAHATRSLASTQVVRWTAGAARAAAHLAQVAALAERLAPAPPGPPRVLLVLGTDLGLCGRLNVHVATAARAALAGLAAPAPGGAGAPPPLRLLIAGRRAHEQLAPGLAPDLAAQALLEQAPTSVEAAVLLADRVLEVARLATSPAGGAPPRPGDVAIVAGRAAREDGGVHVVLLRDPAGHDAPAGPPAARSAPPDPTALRRARALSGGPAAEALAWRALLHARVVEAAARAALTEATARLATMTRAHDAAERRIAEEARRLTRARQEGITQELLEVALGRRAALRAPATGRGP